MLVGAGHAVRFATPDGAPADADDLMITGQGLDPWGVIPGLRRLVAFGRILRADSAGRAAYVQLSAAPEFISPLRWDAIDLDTVDGLLLAARSIDPDTGRSVLYGRRTTSLTWRQERLAASIGRVVRFWDPGYYRTYPDPADQPAGYMSVQSEVTRALARPQDFVDVDPADRDARIKNDGRHRDRPGNARPAHVVVDRNYVSARWPGDAHTFAQRFAAVVSQPRVAAEAGGDQLRS